MAARKRHVPQRTCVGCGQQRPKRQLIRIVRTPQGEVEVDTSGKKSGRGVYLCISPSCWEAGLNRRRVDYGLRTSLTLQSRELLAEYARGLARPGEGVEG